MGYSQITILFEIFVACYFAYRVVETRRPIYGAATLGFALLALLLAIMVSR